MSTNPSESKTKTQMVRDFTVSRIYAILKNGDEGAQKAALAKLRRGAGRKPAECPEVWGYYLEQIPEALIGKGGEIAPGEMAVFTALTLFALHQQSNDPVKNPMHVAGSNDPGSAIAKLIECENDKTRYIRRFNHLASFNNMNEAAHYIQQTVGLLGDKQIPLDYGALAGKFYAMQYPAEANNIRMEWGKSFYRNIKF